LYINKTLDGTKPEFTKRIVDMEGPIAGTVTYQAQFEGKPTPTVKW
jgi:hypothetical protein